MGANAIRLPKSSSKLFERLPSAQEFVSVWKSLIQVTQAHKPTAPFFNHNPAFGLESESEDEVDSEVDERIEASGVNREEKSRARVKDSLDNGSKGM